MRKLINLPSSFEQMLKVEYHASMSFDLSITHALPSHGYAEKHQHNYEVVVSWTGVPKDGIIIDYHDAERVIKSVLKTIHNTDIDDLISPSSEEILIRWIYNKIAELMDITSVELIEASRRTRLLYRDPLPSHSRTRS